MSSVVVFEFETDTELMVLKPSMYALTSTDDVPFTMRLSLMLPLLDVTATCEVYGGGGFTDEEDVRAAFGIALVAPLLVTTVVQGATQKQSALPSAIAVEIFVDGAQSGSGIYLKSGLVITAAHLTSVDARMSVKIAGGVLPATVLKQGSFEDVDLSLLSVDQKKLPPASRR